MPNQKLPIQAIRFTCIEDMIVFYLIDYLYCIVP